MRKEIQALQNKSRRNRKFFDALCLAVWCEVKIPFHSRKPEQRLWWRQILLPSYARYKEDYRTAEEILSRNELMLLLQDFIDTNHISDVTEFRKKIEPIFNMCMTSVFE